MQTIQIFDGIGQLVWSTSLQKKHQLTTNLNLNSGVYFVKIQFIQGFGNQKLVIQK